VATLTFCGATGQVTGSCYLIETEHTRVLLECGLFQGPPEIDALNEKPFPFDPAGIHAVVLSHAHLDHSGRLPKLVRDGFRGAVYVTPPTLDLLGIMLKDAAYLQERDAEWNARHKNNRNHEPEPLYTVADAEKAITLCQAVDYAEPFAPAEGFNVTFHNAGHILGSSIVEMEITDKGTKRRLVFSGDLGHGGSPLLPAPDRLAQADALLLESTYGDRDHRPMADTLSEFEDILAKAAREGGNVLIPAFAVERTQEILFRLGELHHAGRLKQQMVFLDSPMAIAATEVYLKYQRDLPPETAAAIDRAGGAEKFLPVLRLTRTPEESMAINRVRGAIIIAGSGMCTGGRIRHHLKYNLAREDTHIVIVGFQAQGTPGRALVDGAKSLRIFGQDFPVRAQIHTVGGFSAHAGQTELVAWAAGFKSHPRCHLIHGEPDKAAALAGRLKERLGWNAHVPAAAQSVTI